MLLGISFTGGQGEGTELAQVQLALEVFIENHFIFPSSTIVALSELPLEILEVEISLPEFVVEGTPYLTAFECWDELTLQTKCRPTFAAENFGPS